MTYTEEELKKMKTKADAWDALDKKIGALYEDEDDNENEEADLLDVGELAAIAFGYL